MTIEGLDRGQERGDAELLAAVRAGDAQSFESLYDRHAVAALAVARQYTDSVHDAEDVVADSFTAVYSVLQRGHGPSEAFRAYLFTVVRRVAAVYRDRGRRVEATDDVATLEVGSVPMAGADDPTLVGFESSLVARAFASLPERWQLVLWHSEVEGLAPAQIAPLVGLSANSTAALAYRAREGLRQAYLTEHLAEPLDERCRAVADKLGPYVRGGLGARDVRRVEEHLNECPRCRALLVELGDVNHGMRGVIAPLVLGVAGLTAAKALPIGGGIAALSAAGSAGATGTGAAGTGAAAAGAAGTGAAAGTGGASAAGTGAAVGGGVAGGGASGVLAAVPSVAVAAAVAGLTVVAGAAVLVAHLMAAGDPTAASSPRSSVVASPAPAAPASQPVGTPTSQPTTAAATPTTTATATSAAASDVTVDLAQSVLALQAGADDQELRLAVQNTGGQPATDLTAALDLPSGVTLASTADGGASPVGRFGLPEAASTGWLCTASPQTVSCTLGQLDAGTRSVLVVRVNVDESYDAADGLLAIRLSGGGLASAAQPDIPVRVAAAPARIVASSREASLGLVVGRDSTLTLDVVNQGGAATSAATIGLDLPSGVSLVGVSDGWLCTSSSSPTCTGAVGRRATAVLTLTLHTAAGSAPRSDVTTVNYGPTSRAGSLVLPYTVVQPPTVTFADGAALTLSPGGSGTLRLGVHVGEVPVSNVVVSARLPSGVSYRAGVQTPAGCTGGPTSVVCPLGTLAQSSDTAVLVNVDVTGSPSGAATLTLTADGAAPVTATVTPTTGNGLYLREVFQGDVGVTQVGAPLLCGSPCTGPAAAGVDNNDETMIPLDTAPPTGTTRPVVASSSSTTLTLPPGKPVVWAGLYWAASGAGATADRTDVLLRGPSGDYAPVTGSLVYAPKTGGDYESFADVTEQVKAGGAGTWSLADAAVPTAATGSYAGWSLVVVYGEVSATGSGGRYVSVYDDGVRSAKTCVSNGVSQSIDVVGAASSDVTIGVVAWEGDAGITGDRLSLKSAVQKSTPLTPYRWDAGRGAAVLGSEDNAFDSTAMGWGGANSLGVDVKPFASTTLKDPVGTLTATSAGDRYLIGVVTVSGAAP